MSVLVAVNQPQIEISVNEFENCNFIKLNFNFMRNDIEIFFVKFDLQAGRATGKSTKGNTRRVKYQACYEEN